MTRLLRGAAALLCAALSVAAHAQYTTVTASQLRAGNAPIASGTVSFQPRNGLQMGQPISLSGGGLLAPDPFVCHITNGAIDGAVQADNSVSGTCQVPDEVTSSPSFAYDVTITNTTTKRSFVLAGVTGVTGASWALDSYSPVANANGIAITNPVVFRGAYSSARSYSVGDMVTASGQTYVSIISANLGNSPASSPSQWTAIGGGTGGPAVTLQTNGTNNGSQSTLNLAAGSNITLSNSGGTTTITATGSGGGGTVTQIGQVFYSQPGDTLATITSECSSLCTYVVTQPQTITLAANATLSSNIQLDFRAGGLWTVNGSGDTLTIPGNVTGTVHKHFAGSASVAFGIKQNSVPVEWFGAVADWNGSTGTDNAAAIQAAINATTVGQVQLGTGCYAIGSTLTITKSGVGITGVQPGAAIPFLGITGSGASCLMNTNNTVDTLDIAGNSTSANVYGARFENFSLRRSVLPSGTATVAGFSLNYAYAQVIQNVTSSDSNRDFYIHASGSLGDGFENDAAYFGYDGLTETTGNWAGWYVDSADGKASPSEMYRNIGVFENGAVGTGPTIKGFDIEGTAVNDVDVTDLNIANTTYGVYINYTGTGVFDSNSDIHFWHATMDECLVNCIYISDGTNANLVGGSVQFTGGYAYTQMSSATSTVDIENSKGVDIAEMQLGANATTAPYVIKVNGASSINLHHNMIGYAAHGAISLNNTTNSTIDANSIIGFDNTATLINLVASAYNTITGNSLAGVASQGIYLDSASTQVMGLSTNSFGSGVTSPLALQAGTFSAGSPALYQTNVNNGSLSVVQNLSTGASAYMGIQVFGGAQASAYGTGFYAAGPNFTGVGPLFKAKMSYLSAMSGQTAGLLINTESAAPVIIGANNVEAARYNSDGSYTTKYATPPSGACSFPGAWAFAQNGHAAWCNAGTWATAF